MRIDLPNALRDAVDKQLIQWQEANAVERFWQRDKSLWTGADEDRWLGWLDVLTAADAQHEQYAALSDWVRTNAFEHALLLGMGGSSLGPEVLRMTFDKLDGRPDLHVLDSTDPQQVKTFHDRIDFAKTCFIVASKSGSTLEPNILKAYFFDQLASHVGAEQAGKQFVAITDPGSKLEALAREENFAHLIFGEPSVGGRYSALSPFGLVPATIMGLDLNAWLDAARSMFDACGSSVAAPDNPGVMLGAVLGQASRAGRDKLTLFTSPGISDLGAWLEQLIAESTGKQGKAIIPLDAEPLGDVATYAPDRIFAYLHLANESEAEVNERLEKLVAAGHPVIRIELPSRMHLAAEFFRWEVATAFSGMVLEINPFDQPDVEASKIATRKLTAAIEATGALPAEMPIASDQGILLFADDDNAAELEASANGDSFEDLILAQIDRLRPNDYFALLAYIEMNAEHARLLTEVRHLVRDHKEAATCLGFGPRFLHSTGQAYKGGPNTGVFLQITAEPSADVPVPGAKYTFGQVIAAQARGDFEVLAERGRRALRIHLTSDVKAGLERLLAATREALA